MTESYLQMIVFLLLTIGVAFVALGIVARRQQQRSGLINILAYQSLDARRGIAVAVMKVGKELLFLGITPGEIRVLKSMPENEMSEDLLHSRRIEENKRFLQILKERLRSEDN